MFSHRSRVPASESRISRRVTAARAAGRVRFDLTLSNPTEAELSYPPDLLAPLSLAAGLHYAPDPRGLLTARQAIVRHMAAPGVALEPDQLWLTSGTSEAYGMLFKLLCDPGDEVLVPTPGYPLFEHLARFEGVVARSYPLAYDGRWYVDMDGLRRALGPRTRAIVVIHPNNPTGAFLKRDELAALAALGQPIISDEVFCAYGFGHDPDRVTSALACGAVPVFALQGLSKAVGLPQLKLSWLAVGGASAVRPAIAARLELIADCYLSVGTPVQLALPQLLARAAPVTEAIRTRLGENRHTLQTLIGRTPSLSALHVEGGWYAPVRLPAVLSEEDWTLRLLDAGVLVQPGYFFDFPHEAFIVLSLLTPTTRFRDGLAQIARVVGQTVGG